MNGGQPEDASGMIGRIYGITAPTSWGIMLEPSQTRHSVQFVGPNTGRITISTETSGSIDNGITLSGTAGIVEFDETRHGDVVKKAIYGIGDAASRILGVMICERR